MGSSLEQFGPQYEYLSQNDKIDFCLDILKRIPRKIILVDGLAGAGKGTLAARITQGLDLEQISTGDMYRVITWYLLHNGIGASNIKNFPDDKLKEILNGLKINFSKRQWGWWVMDDEKHEEIDISDELHSEEIDKNIAYITGRNPVRDIVDEYQRKIVRENNNVFLEGRDMWQVFAESESTEFDFSKIILVYLYAADYKLIEREIYRQANRGNVIDEVEAGSRVIGRNLADQNKERGKLLSPDQVNTGVGQYHVIIDSTDLEPDTVYLQVLEACVKRF